MKFAFRTLAVMAALVAQAGHTHAAAAVAAPAPVALEIQIGGIGPGVDPIAFRKVKTVIADAVMRGTIDYFDVYGYGKEGGFSACVEKGRFAAAGSFEATYRALRLIKANPSTTAYNVTPVEACTYPQAPVEAP
jgi:hypothetical protein